MPDQLFQTFPRVLRPLFATLPLFTTFLVCQISLVVNIVKGFFFETNKNFGNKKYFFRKKLSNCMKRGEKCFFLNFENFFPGILKSPIFVVGVQ